MVLAHRSVFIILLTSTYSIPYFYHLLNANTHIGLNIHDKQIHHSLCRRHQLDLRICCKCCISIAITPCKIIKPSQHWKGSIISIKKTKCRFILSLFHPNLSLCNTYTLHNAMIFTGMTTILGFSGHF